MRGRTTEASEGKKATRFLRPSTSFEHRRAVIEYLEECRDITQTVDHFYDDLSDQARRNKKRAIYRWVKDKDRIMAMCGTVKSARLLRMRRLGDGKTLSDEDENALVKWIQERHAAGDNVSPAQLSAKALEIAAKRGFSRSAFGASGTWREGFLRRHGLSFRPEPRMLHMDETSITKEPILNLTV